ncbi:MAG: DUF6504 family protein [Verrucomicrobiota bacterium]
MSTASQGSHFVSERIRVDGGEMDASYATEGGPALPVRFFWGKEEIEIGEVLQTWPDYGPCSHGSGERYLRRHYFKVRVTDGRIMTLYFERHQPGRRTVTAKRRRPVSRWYLHSWEAAA